MCDHHFASNVLLVTIIFRGHVSVEEQLKSRVFELMKMLVSIKPQNIFRISIYRHSSFYTEPTLLINSHVCSQGVTQGCILTDTFDIGWLRYTFIPYIIDLLSNDSTIKLDSEILNERKRYLFNFFALQDNTHRFAIPIRSCNEMMSEILRYILFPLRIDNSQVHIQILNTCNELTRMTRHLITIKSYHIVEVKSENGVHSLTILTR